MIATTINTQIKTIKDAKDILKELQQVASYRVLVGVPEENNERQEGEKIGNASLARIHDKGSPKAGIPPRPFMIPGIKKAQRTINKEMKAAAQLFLSGDTEQAHFALTRAGFAGQIGIQTIINQSIGFVPLKRGTLLGRIRKRKYLNKYFKNKPWRNDEKFELISSFKPLIDTAEMMKSITFVVEGPGERK